MTPHAAPRRQWLVSIIAVLLQTLVLLPLPAVQAISSTSSSARSRNRKDNAAYYHSKRARRMSRAHGAQFGNFLAIIKLVFFFSILPILVYFVWSLAIDPDTPRVFRYLYMAGQKRVYRALGWPLPHAQQKTDVSQQPRRQRRPGGEEEGEYFGDPLGGMYDYDDGELRKNR